MTKPKSISRDAQHSRFLDLESQHIEQRLCAEALINPAFMGMDDEEWNTHVLDRVFSEQCANRKDELFKERCVQAELVNADPEYSNAQTQIKLSESQRRSKKILKKIATLVDAHSHKRE